MTKGRLTRQELSWLLTQEAQHAAERLRAGVQILRTQAPPPPPSDAAAQHDPAGHVDASLDALDDVMKMLSSLNQRSSVPGGAPRRGRIDVAALLVEVSPEAPVQIEPGSGTEIFADEADVRRMLQILVGHGSGAGSPIIVRRDGDVIRVSVTLGPDTSPTAETERAWLSRMALRYGGRHELEGGNEVLVFPAEGASERSERDALRKELDEVRRQSEVYARELASMFDRGEEVASTSTYPPAPVQPSRDRLVSLTKICSGVAAELGTVLAPAAREATGETLRRRLAHAQEILAMIAAIGKLPVDELHTEVDLAECARVAVHAAAPHAEREGVTIALHVRPDGARAYVRRSAKAVAALVRELVDHAVAASPRGGAVEVTVSADDPSGPRLLVDDAGSPLPASARRTFLALETHAGAYGRPSGLPIFLAGELAACHGAMLELSDAPQGGLRVTVTFSKG